MPEILPNAPKRRGRPRTVDISYHLQVAENNPQSWVSETYTPTQALSAVRQFKKLGNYHVMTSRSLKEGHRDVIVRKVDNINERTVQ